MSDGFRLELDADAQAKLDALSHEFIADVLLPKMVEKAQRICPVDTGRLKESIHGEVEGDSVKLVAETDYAVYVEQGTRYMAAEPFLRPAVYTALEGLE